MTASGLGPATGVADLEQVYRDLRANPELSLDHFAGVTSRAVIAAAVRDLPSNHSPRYTPVLQPTLATGVAALATAVRAWLPPGTTRSE